MFVTPACLHEKDRFYPAAIFPGCLPIRDLLAQYAADNSSMLSPALTSSSSLLVIFYRVDARIF